MIPSSGGQAHERARGHQGRSHGRRHKKDKEISSGPGFGISPNPISFESAPLPHLKVNNLEPTGTTHHAQPRAPAEPPRANPPADNQKLGAFILGGADAEVRVKNHKQPSRQLWKKGWRASSVTCIVPRLHQSLKFARAGVDNGQLATGADSNFQSAGKASSNVSTLLDFPKDRHGSNLILQCIDLQRHNKELNALLTQISAEGVENFSKTPPSLPTRFYHPASTSEKVHFAPCSSTSGLLSSVDLDQTSLHLLLRKSAAAMCAHCGYDDSSSIALDTLSDVLSDYLTNFTKKLQLNFVHQCETEGAVCQDVMDRSLHQCGIPGKAALNKYWQKNVKGYLRHLENEVAEKDWELLKITKPDIANSASRPKVLEPVDLNPWVTFDPTPDNVVEEEFSLDMILQETNLANVSPEITPGPVGGGDFSQFADQEFQDEESENLSLVMEDGPPRKRLRTMSSDIM